MAGKEYSVANAGSGDSEASLILTTPVSTENVVTSVAKDVPGEDEIIAGGYTSLLYSKFIVPGNITIVIVESAVAEGCKSIPKAMV